MNDGLHFVESCRRFCEGLNRSESWSVLLLSFVSGAMALPGVKGVEFRPAEHLRLLKPARAGVSEEDRIVRCSVRSGISRSSWGVVALSCDGASNERVLAEFLAQQLALALEGHSAAKRRRNLEARLMHLKEELRHRKLLDRACGIVSYHDGVTRSDAEQRIHDRAHRTGTTVGYLAEHLIRAHRPQRRVPAYGL